MYSSFDREYLQHFKYIKDEILLYVFKAICSDVQYWYKMSSDIDYSMNNLPTGTLRYILAVKETRTSLPLFTAGLVFRVSSQLVGVISEHSSASLISFTHSILAALSVP